MKVRASTTHSGPLDVDSTSKKSSPISGLTRYAASTEVASGPPHAFAELLVRQGHAKRLCGHMKQLLGPRRRDRHEGLHDTCARHRAPCAAGDGAATLATRRGVCITRSARGDTAPIARFRPSSVSALFRSV
jgi:hypothetical protein